MSKSPRTIQQLTDISSAATWSATSASLRHGINELLSRDTETYWQSDGQKPHTIAAQFHQAVKVDSIAIQIDPFNDESYTPSVMRVRIGQSPYTTEDVVRTCINPHQCLENGWYLVKFPQRTWLRVIQVEIEECVNGGKDTRIHGVKVYK